MVPPEMFSYITPAQNAVAVVQALAERNMADSRGEQRGLDLLAVPLESYDMVTRMILHDTEPVQALAERDMTDLRGEQRVVDLLAVPLETYDVVTVLGLASYPPLMARLTPGRRREMALTIVRAVLKGDTKVGA